MDAFNHTHFSYLKYHSKLNLLSTVKYGLNVKSDEIISNVQGKQFVYKQKNSGKKICLSKTTIMELQFSTSPKKLKILKISAKNIWLPMF